MNTSNTLSQPPAPSTAALLDKLRPVRDQAQTAWNAAAAAVSGQPAPQPPAGPPQIQCQLNENVTAQLAKILDLDPLHWQVVPKTTGSIMKYVFTAVTKGSDCRCIIDLTDVLAKLETDQNWLPQFLAVGMLRRYLDSDPYLQQQNTNGGKLYIVSEPSARVSSAEIMQMFEPAKSLSPQDLQLLNGMSTEQQKRCVSCYLDLDKAGPCGPNRAWLERLKATSVRIKAKTMSEVDPELTESLESVLKMLPIFDSPRGRNFLTITLPAADAGRSQNDDKDIDISTIVNNAKNLGFLQDRSTLALMVITKNAIQKARGSGLEQELEKVKLGLEEWHNQLEVVWQCVDQAIEKRSQEAGCAAD
jgi:hypothetical protein